jgi:hypothetical protein
MDSRPIFGPMIVAFTHEDDMWCRATMPCNYSRKSSKFMDLQSSNDEAVRKNAEEVVETFAAFDMLLIIHKLLHFVSWAQLTSLPHTLTTLFGLRSLPHMVRFRSTSAAGATPTQAVNGHVRKRTYS